MMRLILSGALGALPMVGQGLACPGGLDNSARILSGELAGTMFRLDGCVQRHSFFFARLTGA